MSSSEDVPDRPAEPSGSSSSRPSKLHFKTPGSSHDRDRDRSPGPSHESKKRRSGSPHASLDSEEERERREKRRRKREKRERRHEERLSSSSSSRRKVDDVRLPKPDARFGHNLFEAERAERAEKEARSWNAKLGSLLEEDLAGGWSEFGSRARGAGGMTGDEDALWEEEMRRLRGWEEEPAIPHDDQSTVPKRWRTAAKGRQNPSRGLGEMEEEEYAEFIRSGMYRRKNAEAVAAAEAREAAAAAAEVEKERQRAERHARKAQEAKDRTSVALDEARAQWERAWTALIAPPTKDATQLGYEDVPWPAVREVGKSIDLGIASLRRFLLEPTSKDRKAAAAQEASTDEAAALEAIISARLRTALRRYHPDRFFSSQHFGRIKQGDQDRVRKAVEKVAQGLSELVGERREAAKGDA